MVKEIRLYKAFDGQEFECRQDAYDHEATLLEKCKLCGGTAQFGRREPNDGGGEYAYVICNSCEFSIDCDPREADYIVLPVGSTCWDYVYARLDEASILVRNKWNTLMKQTPVPKAKPIEPPEPQVTEYEYDVNELDVIVQNQVWKIDLER